MPRSKREMLAAIQSGVLPRHVARVAPASFFADGHFGTPIGGFLSVVSMADLLGLSAAQALLAVGWRRAELRRLVGLDMAICALDTQAPGTDSPWTVRSLDWPLLRTHLRASRHGRVLRGYLDKLQEAAAQPPADHDTMIAWAERTPVGALPDTEERAVRAQYAMFRKALPALGLTEDFSGMGAIITEDGALGARELMLLDVRERPTVTVGEHAALISLGALRSDDIDSVAS